MTAGLDSVSTLVSGTLPFLLDVSLKALVVLLLAFAITRTLRDASASVRHHVWTLAFVAVFALPVLTAMLPSWRVSVPGWQAPTTAAIVADVPSDRPETAASTTPFLRTGPTVAADARGDAVVPAPASIGAANESSIGLLGTGLLVWLTGVAILTLRLGVGITSAWWTSRTAVAIDDATWLALVERVADELGIRQPVRVLMSPAVSTPMAWGLLSPALLLPESAVSWSADRRRAMVLHELAHVKRRDCLIHVVAEAARAVHWPNPLAWIGTRLLRTERERACDDLVLTAGTRGTDYAKLLLDVARSRSSRRLSWATVSMARPSELEGRLLAILDPALNRRGIGRPAAIATVGLVLGVLVPLAALQLGPRESTSYVTADAPAVAISVATRVRADVRVAPEADADQADPRAIEALIRALQHDRASIRSQAAHGLGMAESPLAVEALGRAARGDESADVRSNAAWALGMIEDARAVPSLAAAMDDDDADVREQAAWALGMIESPDGVPSLLRALDDASADLRSQAAWALGMIESPEAVEGLIAILRSDDSADVRGQAAWALGMIEDDASIDVLIDAIEDEDEDVAEQALWALGQVMG